MHRDRAGRFDLGPPGAPIFSAPPTHQEGDMRRHLVRLLALLLVPAVFLAGTDAANAAERYGPRVEFSFSADAGQLFGTGDSIDCSGLAYWSLNADGSVLSVNSRGLTCSPHWWMDDGYAALSYRVNGYELESGDDCSAIDLEVDTHQLVGNTAYAFSAIAYSLDCQFEQLCISAALATDGVYLGDATSREYCMDLPIGGPNKPIDPKAPTGCTWVDPIGKPVFLGAPRRTYIERNVYAQQVAVTLSSTDPTPREFMAYAVLTSPGTSNVEPSGTRVTDAAQSMTVPVRFQENGVRPSTLPNGTKQFVFEVEVSRRWFNSADTPIPTGPAAGVTVTGFGLYATYNSGWTSQSPNWLNHFHSMRSTPQAKLNTTGSGVGEGLWGVTDPAKCSFYWGPKVADKPAAGDNTDEPIGPLEPPVFVPNGDADPGTEQPTAPPEDGGGCDFSVTNPATWVGGGTCALVELMKTLFTIVGQVLGLLARLVPDLVTAFISMFKTLFIPSPSSWGMGGLVDQVKSRPPFSVAKDVTDAGTNFAGGYTSGACQELLDFETIAPGIGRTSVECTDVRSKAGYNTGYTMATWGLYLLTGLGVYRMVAANLGDKS